MQNPGHRPLGGHLSAPDQQSRITQGVVCKCHWDHGTEHDRAGPGTCLVLFILRISLNSLSWHTRPSVGLQLCFLSLCSVCQLFTEFSKLPFTSEVYSDCSLCLDNSPHPSSGKCQGILKSHRDITSSRNPPTQG